MNIGYLYLALNIIFTVYSQIVLKWQLNKITVLPSDLIGKVGFFILFLFTPWVFSAMCAVALGSLTWMMALSKFELSYVYPFSIISYVFVVIFSYLLFAETLTTQKCIGIAVILIGIFILSRS